MARARVIPPMQGPPVADEPAAEQHLLPIRATIGQHAEPRCLTPNPDLELTGGATRLGGWGVTVHRERRAPARGDVHVAVATEQEERRQTRERRVEGVAPHAAVGDACANSGASGADDSLAA